MHGRRNQNSQEKKSLSCHTILITWIPEIQLPTLQAGNSLSEGFLVCKNLLFWVNICGKMPDFLANTGNIDLWRIAKLFSWLGNWRFGIHIHNICIIHFDFWLDWFWVPLEHNIEEEILHEKRGNSDSKLIHNKMISYSFISSQSW